MRDVRIEPGMSVRQRQRLFYLPDLTQMEVAAMLHESVVKDVKPGMLARVRIEALPGRELGRARRRRSRNCRCRHDLFNDVKYFVAHGASSTPSRRGCSRG